MSWRWSPAAEVYRLKEHRAELSSPKDADEMLLPGTGAHAKPRPGEPEVAARPGLGHPERLANLPGGDAGRVEREDGNQFREVRLPLNDLGHYGTRCRGGHWTEQSELRKSTVGVMPLGDVRVELGSDSSTVRRACPSTTGERVDVTGGRRGHGFVSPEGLRQERLCAREARRPILSQLFDRRTGVVGQNTPAGLSCSAGHGDDGCVSREVDDRSMNQRWPCR